MFEDDSYKAHTIHNDLYEALQKSLELDYSNQRLADQEEARKKRRKRHDVPRTQLNLAKLGCDATGYEFKHDYTIIESPRAVVVKEFKIKRLNLGMNTRFWTEKDVTRSKEFITAIERRLKTQRIYRNLECFVGGRVRDIDYRLL
ncbi:hypothetical protein Tco_1387955 [Tanacetum coccineum]